MIGTPLKVIVTVGLPGSGKTYYTEHYHENHPDEKVLPIYFDRYNMAELNIRQLIRQRLAQGYQETLILDGTWLTKDAIVKLLGLVNEAIEEKFVYSMYFRGQTHVRYEMRHIDIAYFPVNREACLKNTDDDSYNDIIENAIFDDIDDAFISELHDRFGISKYKINITNIPVEDWSHYKDLFKSVRFGNHDYFSSEDWVTAGEEGDYNGDMTDLEPEQPKRFDKFYELISDICPNLSDDDKRKLFDECCYMIIDRTDEDYYGSWTEYACWRCDLKKLYALI